MIAGDRQSMISTRTVILVFVLAGFYPSTASADWFLTPFYGVTFGTSTSLLDLDGATGQTKQVFGGSVSLISSGLFGVEADVGYHPGFFSRGDREGVVASSKLWTLSGNVVIAAPLGWTRESLRPYFVGGAGLMRASVNDILDVVQIDNMLAIDVGGGVIGFFNDRTGVRFELRYFTTVNGPDPTVTASFGTARLSQWRATVGLVLKRNLF